jgi:hypothetical protein
VKVVIPQTVDLARYGFPGCKVNYNVYHDHTQGEQNNARDFAIRQALRGLMSTSVGRLILPVESDMRR